MPAKSNMVIAPFTVIIDSREQHPYSFNGFETGPKDKRKVFIVPVDTDGLKTGDYSIKGLESRVAIERKSKADLYGTIGSAVIDYAESKAWDNGRFVKELLRLNEMDYGAVVIEASWASCLLNPPEHSDFKPRSLMAAIMRMQKLAPRVHWWAFDTRGLAEKMTFRMLEQFWNDVQQGKVK